MFSMNQNNNNTIKNTLWLNLNNIRKGRGQANGLLQATVGAIANV